MVDDEEDVRAIASEMLRSLGYKVTEAASGTEALMAYEQHKGKIDMVVTDVVVTDVVMPEMNGPALVDHLRRLSPGIKVLFTSGYTNSMHSREEHVDPSAHFLQKPIGLGALARKVREILDENPTTQSETGLTTIFPQARMIA